MAGVLAPTGPAYPHEATVCGFGQSNELLASQSDGPAGLINGLRAAGGPSLAETLTYAANGSALLEAFAGAVGFWLATDGSDGTHLTAAKAMCAAMPRRSLSGVWTQGEQESVGGFATDAHRIAYRDGLISVLGSLRSAMNPADANAVTMYVHPLGRRTSNASASVALGCNLVRQAHCEAIASTTWIAFAGEYYDLPLRDDVHLTHAGFRRMKARLADVVAAQYNGSHTPVLGPLIASATRQGPRAVDVPVTVEAGQSLITPGRPAHFGVYASDGKRIDVTGGTWTGSTVRLALAADLGSGGTLRYPDGALYDWVTPDNVVRYAGADRPLRSTVPVAIG
ncbi:MAG: hypothetical protein AAFO79_09220 [Pseudomonadota bacterium]